MKAGLAWGVVAALVLAGVLVVTMRGPDAREQIEAYCAEFESKRELFAGGQSAVDLVERLEDLRELADQSPDDLSDDWQTFVATLSVFGDAITSVGLTPAELVDGQAPAGTNAADAEKLAAAANQLTMPDVVAAAQAIEQQARDVCKLQLGF